MEQLEVPAGHTFQKGPFIDFGTISMHGLVPTPGAALAGSATLFDAPFVALHAPNKYPSGALDITGLPIPLGDAISADVADVCVRVEVLATDSSSTSSSATKKAAVAKAAAGRASTVDPLRAMMQSLRVPIGTDIDASNIAEARTRLDEDRQRLLDLTETLAATQRRLDSAQLERNAAYGFTPAAPEPSWVANVQARGGAIGRAFGALPPVYETPAKNMRSAQAAAADMDQLTGEEL